MAPDLPASGHPRQRRRRDQHALGVQVRALPVAVLQAVQAHRAAGARRMHEATLADVDAGMAHGATTGGGEEHQVAGLQGLHRHAGRAHGNHLAGRARQLDAGHVAVDEVDQAAAIEARIGRVAAPAVGRADQAEGTEQHIVGGGREIRRRTEYDLFGGRGGRRFAGAGGKQRSKGEDRESGQCMHSGSLPGEECFHFATTRS